MKKRNAYTILEVILSLALISIIVISGTRLLLFAVKVNDKTASEFEIQSYAREISQNINKIIRDASGVFLLEKEDPDNPIGYFTDGWDYLMLNKEKTKLIQWTWDRDENTHIKKDIIESLPGINLNLTYEKINAANQDKLVGYVLEINNGTNTRTIETELEGLNTLQIMDRSYEGIPNTIAYRNDARVTDLGVAHAAVSFVIDKSGSMTTTDMPGNKSRMAVLKEEAIKFIDGLNDYDNINLSLTPFSNSGNNKKYGGVDGSNPSNNWSLDTNVMIPLKANSVDFKNAINQIKADGGTNTGDGMRRGFYSIKKYNDSNEGIMIKNFMIILVDGDTSFASAHKVKEINEDVFSWKSPKEFKMKDGIKYYYTREQFLFFTKRFYYTNVLEYVLNSEQDINEQRITGDNIESGYTGHGSNSDNLVRKYVNLIGDEIIHYKNTRNDGIDVFVIGFSKDIGTDGLKNIRDATNAKKVYQANSQEALEAVLNEIKFQISDSLWHIGGPN